MDVLLTPDVISLLEITGSTITSKGVKKPYVLLSFSRTHITFISSEQTLDFEDSVSAEIKSKYGNFSIDVFFEATVRTSTKHWIFRFSYSPLHIIQPLKDKWLSVLSIKDFQQVRKETRLSINKEIILALHLRSAEIQVWVAHSQKTCVLHDLSFSGARFLSTDDLVIDSDDKVISKISFLNPSEIATVRAVVLRKRIIDIGGIPCFDIAVNFLDPVDFVLLSRLTTYFQQISRDVQLASCEAN